MGHALFGRTQSAAPAVEVLKHRSVTFVLRLGTNDGRQRGRQIRMRIPIELQLRSSLPTSAVVFGVRQNVANVDAAKEIINLGN